MNRIEAPHMQSFMIQAFSAKDMTSAMLVKQNKFTSPRTGVWSVIESNIFKNWTWENWRILRSQISSIHFSASIDIDFGAGGLQGTWHVDVPKSQLKGKHNYFASASIENPRNFEFLCLWRSTLSLQHGKKKTHLKAGGAQTCKPLEACCWESLTSVDWRACFFAISGNPHHVPHQPCVVVVLVVVVVEVETGHATPLVAMLHWILYEGFHQVSPI